MTPRDRDAFMSAYIAALYFTDTGDTDQPPSDADLSPEAYERCRTDCAAFLDSAGDLIEQAQQVFPWYTIEGAGHDFWLTRNGHGAGFWDRGLGTLGDQLTANAKPYGECFSYQGDDGLIYLG